MHPAPSIIIFTTMSGMGYGLAFLLGVGALDPAALSTKAAHLSALCLIGGGLLSSTLHLGNPQRAWRALSQWRSSWLSREGVLALAAFVPITASAWLCVFENRYSAPLGVATAAVCLATVFSTSMIYASLRSIDSWCTPLTPASYLLQSLATGSVACHFFSGMSGSIPAGLSVSTVFALLAGWAARFAWRHRMRTLSPTSTAGNATGLGRFGRVRQIEAPHATHNYLTREMGFEVARKHADKLFAIAVCAGLVLPVLCVLAASAAGTFAVARVAFGTFALVGASAGLLVERWLFFAEARHSVMAFYGR